MRIKTSIILMFSQRTIIALTASLLTIFCVPYANAEEEKISESIVEPQLVDPKEKPGKAIFTKYGIADDIPKLGLSSLTQGQHLVEHVKRSVQIDEQISQSEVFLVQNTDEKENIDLRIKYNPVNLAKEEDVIEHIQDNTRTEYRLRDYIQSYDDKSVKAVELENGHVEISFNYSKYGLPQDIAYFRFMRVKIDVKDGQPLSMVLTNSQPFTYDKYTIHTYHQKIIFKTLPSGKVLIKRKSTVLDGETKKNKTFKLTTITTPVAYYDDDEITVLDEKLLLEASDPRMREARVKVDNLFPLMGDMIRRKGIDIPKPYGISVSYRKQEMEFAFTDFNVLGIDFNDLFDPSKSIGTVSAESLVLRGDVYILPFWNIYGLFGKIKVEANVNADYTGKAGDIIKDKLNDKLTGLGDAFCKEVTFVCEQGNLNIPLQLQYDVVGFGTTLAVGYREFFASVTGTYSMTRLEGNSEFSEGILTVQPMLGYQLVDYRTQFFVGAEYQGLKPYTSGTIDSVEVNGEKFNFNVGIDLEKWAYLVGVNKEFGKNYNVTVLFNKGETRTAGTVNFGYRF
ncbi:hypothetical protein [Psychromonas marina]|nr:hypothetical protein [Psychromonas marina]